MVGLKEGSVHGWDPHKFEVVIGSPDHVAIETRNAIYICSGDRVQAVGKIVERFKENHHKELL